MSFIIGEQRFVKMIYIVLTWQMNDIFFVQPQHFCSISCKYIYDLLFLFGCAYLSLRKSGSFSLWCIGGNQNITTASVLHCCIMAYIWRAGECSLIHHSWEHHGEKGASLRHCWFCLWVFRGNTNVELGDRVFSGTQETARAGLNWQQRFWFRGERTQRD